MTLDLADFSKYFEELWGHSPFPWQLRLMTEVAQGSWPAVLDLPTGSGKTAVLDIACFALALDAQQAPENRQQYRRIALIIDRRIVVDQAYERAKTICERLTSASSGVLGEVSRALRTLHSGLGSQTPITVAALRGGTVRDNNWARSPDQPCFLISTVDQIGSRLLFRGYGVSSKMAPVHAGLLGIDCLYLLDEVHLSRPFAQTLNRIIEYGSLAPSNQSLSRKPTLVSMSATPGKVSAPFKLDQADLKHSVLRQRLSAKKAAKLVAPVKIRASRSSANESIAKACVKEAMGHIEQGAKATAIIVNRVETARQAANLASKKLDRVVLLTGRMRPIDRDAIQKTIADSVQAGRNREKAQAILIVSTQAIEAGADYDFDAIVTECASLDALRQRFGRLDRRGELDDSSRASIVVGDRAIAEQADDPIYGHAIKHSWDWLQKHAQDSIVDMGMFAQEERGVPPESALSSKKKAPELLPAYLDLWAQTAPKPAIEPDIPPFLHGAEQGAPQVQIVWRRELDGLLLHAANDGTNAARSKKALEILAAVFEVCPPSALECISIPLWTARTWLSQSADPEAKGSSKAAKEDLAALSDLEGASAVHETPSAERSATPFLVYDTEGLRASNRPEDVHTGSTVVLPTSFGGIHPQTKNWDPDANDPVEDLGDLAQLLHRGRAVLRWPSATEQSSTDQPVPDVDSDELEERGEEALKEAFVDWEQSIANLDQVEAWKQFSARWLVSSRSWNVIDLDLSELVDNEESDSNPHGSPRSWRASVSPRRIPRSKLNSIAGEGWTLIEELASESDQSSFTSVEVALEEHLKGVEEVAAAFAKHLALPSVLAGDLALAGLLHDLGKSDPRFQVMLRGGDRIDAAYSKTLLAKSALPFFNLTRRQRAQELAGYPKGARHELMSVALVQHNAALRERAKDWDLVLHLVASHHGHCRPFAPVLHGDPGVDVNIDFQGDLLQASSAHKLHALDSGITERYWRLVHRYGWHGLAFLEAVLRLADHRRSEIEQLDGAATS